MYASIDACSDAPKLKITPLVDRHSPGLRIEYGPLYLSLVTEEVDDLVDAIIGALAELDAGIGTGVARTGREGDEPQC